MSSSSSTISRPSVGPDDLAGIRSIGVEPVVAEDELENTSWRRRFVKLEPARRAQVAGALLSLSAMAVLSLAVPVVLLVIFHGHQMTQVGILATALCSYVFLLQLCVRRSCSFYADLGRISYGLLLSYFSAGQIGSRAAIVILHLTTAWAAAYLGYSLASHRLRMGTERAIIDGELPQPCHHGKDRAYMIANMIPVAAFIVTLIWTASMAAIIFTNDITDEFDIVFLLSYVGWIHVAVWLSYVADVPMRKVLMKEPMVSLLASLLPCLMISPVISAVCRILSILFQWLMMSFGRYP